LTNESKQQFSRERVRALATIVLTRRGDLTVIETKKDTGLDFHVTIEREDNSMRLMFGVLLRGVRSPFRPSDANKVLGPTMGQFHGMRKFTYPVCLFVFTTLEEHAFFSWLAEPLVTEGAPKLIHHINANCIELTNERLDQVVEAIVSWYDAVESVLIG
jgi:hypothetical protein